MLEELKRAMLAEIRVTRTFQYVPARSNVRNVELVEDGNVGLGGNGEILHWELVFDADTRAYQLNLLGPERTTVMIATLTREGIWKGRDRLSGTILMRPREERLWKWVLLASPIKYAQSLRSDDTEDEFHYKESLPPQIDWGPFQLNLKDHIDSRIVPENQTAIALVGCDRPTYFKQMAESLALQPGIEKYPIFVFLDKPVRPEDLDKREEQAKLARALFSNCVIIKRPRNFGCGRNLIDARRQLFDYLGYRRAFVFEDDMILSQSYMQFCINLMNWAEANYSNVGAVQGWSFCIKSQDQKRTLQSGVQATSGNWWGYLMSDRAWQSIREPLSQFEKLFLGGEYRHRPHESIRSWFRIKSRKPRMEVGTRHYPMDEGCKRSAAKYFDSPPTGQDAATMQLFHQAGWTRLCPVVNRSQYIGQEGIHMNPRMFRQHGLDAVHMYEFADDTNVKNFELIQDMLKPDELASPVDGMMYQKLG